MSTALVSAHIWDEAFAEELEQRRRDGLYRALRVMDGAVGPVMRWRGRELVIFASNNYLGLAHHPRVIAAVQQAAAQCGTGAGAARLMTGTLPAHEALEQRLAAFKGTEAALVFGSGYLTNLGTIQALVGPQDAVFCDRLNHASLVDGCRLSRAKLYVYPHGDAATLGRWLARAGSARRKLIVTDGVFSMDGDVAPLPALLAVAERWHAAVLLDDAHGSFVLGARGRGTPEWHGMTSHPCLMQMGTLSKALGALGGYVAGSRRLADYLINWARSFIYATAMPPTVAAGALAALEIVETQPALRRQVMTLADLLRAGLQRQGWPTGASTTHIVPVLVGDAAQTVRLSERLLERGFLVPAVRPPTVPKGTARLRFSVMATHTTEHIDALLQALGRNHQ